MAVNVKVVAKYSSQNSSRDDLNFKYLHTAFKRAVAKCGVLKEYRKHESYESPGQKKRRKKRESLIQVLKSKMRESFLEQNGTPKPRKERDVE